MKKITLALAVALSAFTGANAQITVEAPPNTNATSAFRAPNGTSMHSFQRTVMYISSAEMFPLKIGTLNTFSFQYVAGAGTSQPATGNFTIYLQNTNDTQYNKGTNFTTAVSTMSVGYLGTYTLPATTGAATVGVNLTTPMSYTGGGLYVAWDWVGTQFSATTSTYLCNNSQVWCATADASVAPVSNVLGGSAFRPSILFGATNTATNEVEVFDIVAQGKHVKLFNSPAILTSDVVNWGTNAVNNLSVTMTATGANPYTLTQVIPNLAPASVQTLTWSAYTPTNLGVSSISITSNHTDQIMSNNNKVWTQSVTCDVAGMNPPSPIYDTGFGFTATGNFAVEMTPATVASLTAIRVGVYNTTLNVGTALSGVLMDVNGTILEYSTNTITVTNPMLGTFQNLFFNQKPTVTGATPYLFGVSQHSASSYPIGVMYESAFPAPIVYYTTPLAGGTAPTPITNVGGWLFIEPVFAFPGMQLTATAPSSVFCLGATQAITLTANGPQSFTWFPASLGNAPTATWVPHVNSQAAGAATQIIVNGGYTTGIMTGCRTNSVAMLFMQQICTGINEASFAGVQVFPNPAVNGISSINGLTGTNSIVVYNTLGQAVIREKVDVETYTLDLSAMPSGSYVLKITNEANESKVVKFVNQR